MVQETAPLQWIEFFAGKAEATRAMQQKGLRTAKLDLMYMNPKEGMNPMDLLSDGGMGCLGCAFMQKYLKTLFFSGVRTFWMG